MRIRPSLFVVVGLAACGSNNAAVDAHIIIPDAAPDAKVFMDAPAPVYDFSCLGNGAPPSTAANLTVGGTFTDVSYVIGTGIVMTPLANATIKICKVGTNCTGGTNLLSQVTADGAGAFTSAAISATNPVDGFVRATATGERPVDEYPPSPLIANLSMLPLVTSTNTNLGLLELAAGVTQDAGKGILGVAVVDCSATPQPITGATITVKQGGNDVTGTTVIDGSGFGMGGGAIIFNVPTGANTMVGATYMGMTFRAHPVEIVNTTTVVTAVKPGY